MDVSLQTSLNPNRDLFLLTNFDSIGPLDLPEAGTGFRYPSVVRKIPRGWVDTVSPKPITGSKTTQKRKQKRQDEEDKRAATGGREKDVTCGKGVFRKKRRTT